VAGDLALRVSWGDNPNFVFSLGGFNPHFNTVGLDVPTLHRLTVSIGVGSIRDGDVADALQRADEALYDAKHSGRNRTVSAQHQLALQ